MRNSGFDDTHTHTQTHTHTHNTHTHTQHTHTTHTHTHNTHTHTHTHTQRLCTTLAFVPRKVSPRCSWYEGQEEHEQTLGFRMLPACVERTVQDMSLSSPSMTSKRSRDSIVGQLLKLQTSTGKVQAMGSKSSANFVGMGCCFCVGICLCRNNSILYA